jgi:hypothetical protein
MAKMSDTVLKALLQAERNASLGGSLTSDLTTDRAKAMDYYNGDLKVDMPSAEGRSSAISSDVADTIEGLMPSLMEIFTAGEEVVRFDPVGPEDEEAAKQETDYVNHVFTQKNPGFMVLYSFIKDALLSKNGIVKIYWDESEKEERETYIDQDEETFTMLASQPDVEISEHTPNTQEDGTITHDVTLIKRAGYKCAKVVAVPPEEFGISRNARTIKDTTYCFHQVKKTQADLIAQGFDETQIMSLPSAGQMEKEEEQARDTVNEDDQGGDTVNKAARLIDTIEHYVLMDYEDNGKPGLYRVTTGGTQLEVLKRNGKADVVPVDEIPFASMTPIIITHRFFGRSVADLVMDIMRVKTAIVRQYLDNIYLLNNQRIEVSESHMHERTVDDLLVNRPGAIVRTKQPGGLTPIVNQPIGNTVLPALEYFDATREWRTGVTRQGQGIDANALQNQSATAVNQAFTAAQARMKLIARIFAETGVRDMFLLLHGCIRKNDKAVNTVRLRNKWVTVDPRQWKTRNDMTIDVGLGTGGKQEQAQAMMGLLNIQKEMLMGKLPTVTPKNIYNTAAKFVEKIGFKSAEPYFTDPDSEEGQKIAQAVAQQPDPEVMKLQMEAQLAEKADERKAQIETVQAQADMATNQQKLQMEAQMAEREFQLKKELAIMEAQLDQMKFEREESRKEREHAQNMTMQREQHEAGMREGAFKVAAGQEAHAQKMEQSKAKAEKADA